MSADDHGAGLDLDAIERRLREENDAIPRDILTTLFRALVWCGDQITREQQEQAWAWLEERNPYDDMGRGDDAP